MSGGFRNDPHRVVQDAINLAKERLLREQIEVLKITGEKAVQQQTVTHKYLNQTGNLSSSVGYTILLDGRPIWGGGFKPAKGEKGDGEEGAKNGKEFIESLYSEYSKGLVLLLVAGMNYAAYVENMGLDVLTTAELTAEKLLPELLKEL